MKWSTGAPPEEAPSLFPIKCINHFTEEEVMVKAKSVYTVVNVCPIKKLKDMCSELTVSNF